VSLLCLSYVCRMSLSRTHTHTHKTYEKWHGYMRSHVNTYINTHAHVYVDLSLVGMSLFLSVVHTRTHELDVHICTGSERGRSRGQGNHYRHGPQG
jgi:hypothetical protein